MNALPASIQVACGVVVAGALAGTVLVLAYLGYDRHPLCRTIGDFFMGLSIGNRDKRDILLLAVAPYTVSVLAALILLMLR